MNGLKISDCAHRHLCPLKACLSNATPKKEKSKEQQLHQDKAQKKAAGRTIKQKEKG